MNLQQAIKTILTARAWIGLSNHFHAKGNDFKADYCAEKGYNLFVSIPDQIGSKARKVLDL